MPTPSTSDLPKPKSWDEFEDIVWDIYTRKWKDPNAKRYGRTGQAQKGIDIYGQQNSSNNYVAVQCKCYGDNKLNVETIAAEVKKAESFSSKISEYLIATTVSRNIKIQDDIRNLNNKRHLQNKFTVHVVFWEDLCSYLAHPDNYDLLTKHYGVWEHIFANPQKEEGQKVASIRYLLSLEIQRDCELLQEIIAHNEEGYLSNKWQSCLSQNRGVWKDISCRILLSQSGDELMRHIHNFYKHLDSIEENCKDLLALKSKAQTFESKPKYENGILRLDTIPLPAWTEKYFTEADEIALLNSKKRHYMKLRKLKEIVPMVLNSGNLIVDKLNQQ
ncbi:restriction endonuclease [Microcoleus sp. Pol11C1]|uniref:restriction endonuclease n=1 Tax=unclassified Microcoleus TaxID=2642155 RepID=UPI002FD34861